MELLNAKSLVSEAKAQETREVLGQSVAKMPDEAAQARHRLTHTPYASWPVGVRSALNVERAQIAVRG